MDATPPTGAKLGARRASWWTQLAAALSVVVAGANVHDTKLLRPTLDSIVVAGPEGTQNLCLDKGYDNPTGHGTVAAFRYCPHIRRIGEEKLDRRGEKTFPARRWVVEQTLSWRCRPGALRQEAHQLPGPASGLRPHLVPPSSRLAILR